jgi:hypothetical protein
MFKFFSALLVLLTFVQCRRIDPAIPEQKVAFIPTLIQEQSTVYVPIKINLLPYLKDTEKSLPKSFTGKEDNCSGVSYSYEFNRNPIQFDCKGKELYYEVDGKYSLKLNYCPECTYLFKEKGSCIVPRIYVSCGIGEEMRRVTVGYATQFKITPDFRFKTTTVLRKFETIDPCEISVFNYDATKKLREELTVELKELEKVIDKEIASIDIRSEMEEVWKVMSAQTSLGRYGYLSISPKAISLSDIRFRNNTAFLDLNLTIQPIITTFPSENPTVKLPKLSDHQIAKGFDINLDIVASYDSLSAILSENLAGKSVEIKNNEVIFGKMTVEGALNDQLILKVAFSGKRQGELYFIGTPKFDAEKQEISFPDLVFDLRTKNVLLKSAKWLFNSKITDMLRLNAHYDLKPQLDEMKKIVQKEMNREIEKGVTLSGRVESISLLGIYPGFSSLTIRVNSEGELSLSM